MTNKCLDEGTLQGYLDGELSPERMRAAAAHLALCADCNGAARDAETELSFFAVAFAADDAAKVPTEKLRQRIDAAIQAREAAPREIHAESIGMGIREWLASLAESFTWSPQRAGALAGLAAVVLLGAVFVALRPRTIDPVNNGGGTIAVNETPEPVTPTPTPDRAPIPSGVVTDADRNQSGATTVKASTNATYKSTRPRVNKTTTAVADRNNALLPGEENYLRTINSLAKTIDAGGDAALRPAARAEYERNLAVIDEAISESRRVARRNPRDADAAAFLFSAYQNKVELMGAVADQSQLAAAGR